MAKAGLNTSTLGLTNSQRGAFIRDFLNNKKSLNIVPIKSQGIVSGLASGLLNGFFDRKARRIALERGLPNQLGLTQKGGQFVFADNSKDRLSKLLTTPEVNGSPFINLEL